MYRSFHPPDKSHVNDFFVKQLAVIKNALCSNCYVMGDFNLDGGPDLNPNYCNRNLLTTLNVFANESGLIQVVDFNTWSRTVKGIKKESMLDHVYLNNFSTFVSVY